MKLTPEYLDHLKDLGSVAKGQIDINFGPEDKQYDITTTDGLYKAIRHMNEHSQAPYDFIYAELDDEELVNVISDSFHSIEFDSYLPDVFDCDLLIESGSNQQAIY
jgi:hypothetical protein